MSGADETQYAPPRNLLALYLGFLSIGARSFGGVLPWAHRTLVEERRWLEPADFAAVVALCQFMPGPNIGNASVLLGRRWFGARGAVVAFLGLMGLPFCWVLALALVYGDFAAVPAVRGFVTGMGIAGGGLFIGTALKLGKPLRGRPAGLALAAACFAALAFARVSLFLVLPLGMLLAWLAARRSWL